MLTPRSFGKEEVAFQSGADVAKGNGLRSEYGKSLELDFVCTKFLSLCMSHKSAPNVFACFSLYIAVSIGAALSCLPFEVALGQVVTANEYTYATYGLRHQRINMSGLRTEIDFHEQHKCIKLTYNVNKK